MRDAIVCKLARTLSVTHDFPADETEILAPSSHIESVTKLELKTTEAEGWVEQTGMISSSASNPSFPSSFDWSRD